LFNKNVHTILTVFETVQSFWKLVSKDQFPPHKKFRTKTHWVFGNTYVCEVLHFLRWSKSKIERNTGRYSL